MKKLIGLVITPDLARGIGLALDAMSDTVDFVEELWDEGRMVGNHEEAVTEKVSTFLTRMDSEQGRAYQAITEEFQKLDADRERKSERKCLSCGSYTPCWCEY